MHAIEGSVDPRVPNLRSGKWETGPSASRQRSGMNVMTYLIP